MIRCMMIKNTLFIKQLYYKNTLFNLLFGDIYVGNYSCN